MNIITYRFPSRRVLRHLNSTVTSPQLDRNIILLAHRRALTCVVFLTAEHDTQGPILVGVEKKNTRVLTYRTPPLPHTHSRGAYLRSSDRGSSAVDSSALKESSPDSRKGKDVVVSETSTMQHNLCCSRVGQGSLSILDICL